MKKYAESKGFFDFKQKGNYIPLLKHGESVQVNEERGYCCPRTAKTGNLYRKKNRQLF